MPSKRFAKVVVGDLTLHLDPTSPVQAEMLRAVAGGGYEPGVTWAIRHYLRTGETAVDIGAHVGVLTGEMAQRVGKTGRVHAFEPHAGNRTQLLRHVKGNKLHQVRIDKRAVAARTGSATFYACADNDGGHALYNPGAAAGNVLTRARPSQSPVTTTTLDEAIPTVPRVALIKCDTEGAECGVFRGATRILSGDRPVVIAEINWFGLRELGESEQSLRAIFRAYGYREAIVQDREPYLVPVTEEESGQTAYEQRGVGYFPVFNMIFLPT